MANTKTQKAIGQTILYKGKQVKVVEEAKGFVTKDGGFWCRALEPVDGFKKGEELTVSRATVYKQLKG